MDRVTGVVYEGTVASGLEKMAVEEVKEVFGEETRTRFERGHVFFQPHESVQFGKIFSLRSFNHVSVVILDVADVDLNCDKGVALNNVKLLIDMVDWERGLEVWQSVHRNRKVAMEDGHVRPKFRVTCVRLGKDHAFGSMDAASVFGAAIVDKFSWPVDLDNFDVEVLLKIDNSRVRVALALTTCSLAQRNVVRCGPTTMRATIAYGLLRLCRLKDYEIVCDPMCGSGSIFLEALHSWPRCTYIAGDIAEQNVNVCKKNLANLSHALPDAEVQLFHWDAQQLPLLDNSVDCIITDLPYGKRVGSAAQNKTLYPSFVQEVNRVLRPGGRACIVTLSRKDLCKCLQHTHLKLQKAVSINLGGLYPSVLILKRFH